MLDSFWSGWVDRFDREHERYITPNNRKVLKIVGLMGLDEQSNDKEKAEKCWDFVYNNLSYHLSRKWKTPEETLSEGIGDCEDFTFLISSMLAASDTESEMVVGNLTFSDGRVAEHTWNTVEGMVIDATGHPEVVKTLEYTKIYSWDIKVRNNG